MTKRYAVITFALLLVWVHITVLCSCDTAADSNKNDAFVLNTDPTIYNDKLVFSFTPDEFIKSYNGHYRADHGQDYLRQKSGWELFENDVSPFSESESDYYRFLYDRNALTFPMISVYTPSDKDTVQGITIDFDDHGYTPYYYEVYEEQCFYALKAVLPEADSSTLTQIHNELFCHAGENIKNEKLNVMTVPDIMYCCEDVGIFSHFSYGSYIRLCIVPVTDERLDALKVSGTDIRHIQELEL